MAGIKYKNMLAGIHIRKVFLGLAVLCLALIYMIVQKKMHDSSTEINEFSAIIGAGFNQGIYTRTFNQSRTTTFEDRRRRITEVCTKRGFNPPTSIMNSLVTGRMFVEDTNNILYCPVEKVGSTFWKRVLGAMKSQGRITSPYNIKFGEKIYKVDRFQTFRKEKPRKVLKSFLNNAVSLLVVRDPYRKLFSGYVDKLYHPNYLFWDLVGKKIQRIVHKSRYARRLCGNNISFSDFIKYVILMLETNPTALNPHFTPIYRHCNPCTMKYDYISKFETFQEDFEQIIQEWNARFNLNITTTDFETGKALYIATRHVNISFATIQQYEKVCHIPRGNFLLRTWHFLQISGIVSKDIDLPFKSELDKVTKKQFLEAIKTAISSNTDSERVKRQREEALIQAYKSLQTDDLKMLQKLVKPDCEFFGYNDRPAELFNGKYNSSFNYFDGLT